ncbi:receptor kinase, putative [Ricinus communis]|uniref:Receptor kinase, putative n=1 Tax=Ricinus communis TaxID=3988 RepID=B9SLY9_RICCO|nr:receptor kinase, putative [Ricinus communis]
MAAKDPPISLVSHSTFFVLCLCFHLLQASSPNLDLEPLLKFKALSDASNNLADWNSTANDDPCNFTGVFCFKNRVSRLVLENLGLNGSFQPLTSLTQLRVLSLKRNNFSGPLPDLSNLTALKLLFLSHNQFSGLPVSVFAQNAGLCGSPMQVCKGSVVTDPAKPGSDGAIASPLMPVVSSSPSSIPPNKATNTTHNKTTKIGRLAIIAIVLGDVLVLSVISLLLYCYFWRNYAAKMREGKGSKLLETEKIVYSSSPYPNQAGFERGRMVFFEGVKKFELEDLLRASAEMLGKGGFGTAYKAVLDDGNVVAVKRLKDANVGGKREFEQHMEVLGRLRHPNLVSLKAYYFAREEKLLVYDYMPNGSLFWLLHVRTLVN